MNPISIIETEVWKKNPDRPGTVIFDHSRPIQDINNELKAHLMATGCMPDEYLLFTPRGTLTGDMPFPKDGEILCSVNYGSSEGIYLNISVRYEKEVYERNNVVGTNEQKMQTVIERLATGKTLGDTIEDLDKMHLVASSVMAAFYGDANEVRERYAQIESGEVIPPYPCVDTEQINSLPRQTSDVLQEEHRPSIREDQLFERKMTQLIPDADKEGIQNLIEYATELDKDDICEKTMFLENTFSEFYLVAHLYNEEIAEQLVDMCKSNALNFFEIRGAAYHLLNGVEPAEIGQMAIDGLCDPPEDEPFSTDDALKAYEAGLLSKKSATKQDEAEYESDKPCQTADNSKPKTLADKMQAANERVKAQDTPCSTNKSLKKEER